MNFRIMHRSGTSKFQNQRSIIDAGKKAPQSRRSVKLLSLIAGILLVVVGLGGLAFAVQQSTADPEQSQNPALYPSYRGNVWSMLELQHH